MMEAYMAKAYTSKNTDLTTSVRGLADLPLELQDAVISKLSSQSLRSLQRVSRHFHERASRALWRGLLFKLTAGTFLSPSSKYKLVEALRTITTSEHNYAQYIHIFSLDILQDDTHSSSEMQIAHKFLPDSDSQKLLSLSMFLLLRKATSLEVFRWAAPVELDDSCWKQLASSRSLRCLAVRLDARQAALTACRVPHFMLPHRHIAGCSGIIRLELVEIEDLYQLDHIAAAIRLSAGSLKRLRLSFSQSLTAKAKKVVASPSLPPPVPMDIEFDDQDVTTDEEEDNIAFVIPGTGASQPQPDTDALGENKAKQDNALARLLSVEPESITKGVELVLQNSAKAATTKATVGSPELAKSMHELVDKLCRGQKVSSDDAQLVEKLRSKLDNAAVSRSAKRQKPSGASKIKAKLPKPSATVHGLPPSYTIPKSSTSSLSNPWATAPYSVHSPSGAPFGSGAQPPTNPFSVPAPPANYPMHLTTSVHPPGTSTSSAVQSSLFATTFNDHAAALLDADGNTIDYTEEDLALHGFGGSSGEYQLFTYPPKAQNDSPSALMQTYLKLKEKIKNLPKTIPKSSFPYGTNSWDHYEKLLDKKIATLTKQEAAPPPPHQYITGGTAKIKASKKNMSSFDFAFDDSASDTSESISEQPKSGTSTTTPDHNSSDNVKAAAYDDMGVDIIHPDHDDSDSGGEKDFSADQDDTPRSLKDKGKEKAVVWDKSPRPLTRSVSPNKRSRGLIEEDSKVNTPISSEQQLQQASSNANQQDATPERTMREWIRMKHGLALEAFELYLIPLKASVVGKAIQLHTLKQVTLLSVGGQGPFWQLMCKAQEESPLSLTHIMTDDVGVSFLQCTSKLNNLRTLYLHRRLKKAADNTTSKDPASIEDIRRLAVQPHIETLEFLSIENSQDQSWCLTQAFIALICARADRLQELAFQCGSHRVADFCLNTDGAESRPRPSRVKLPRLVAVHYLGVGPVTTSPGVHVSSTSSTLLALNGEPASRQHDDFARDNYKNCWNVLQAWAKRRKIGGDTNLRYVAIRGLAWEVGPPKVVKEIPKWLHEDFVADCVRVKEKGKGTGLSESTTLSFDKWVKNNGYEGLIQRETIECKARRPQDLKTVRIFSNVMRRGKF